MSETPPTRPSLCARTGQAWRLLRVAGAHLAQERRARFVRQRLLQHQQRELARLRRWAVERSAFYRRFHRGLHDQPLAALPVLHKSTVMEHFDQLVTDPRITLRQVHQHVASAAAGALYLGRYVVLSTSGTTGQRGLFLFDRDEWIQALAAITRPLAWAGAPPPWTRPRSAFIASTQAWHFSGRIAQDLASPLAPSLRCDAAWPQSTLVQRLNQWQPQVLAVYPSVLAQLVQAQRQGGLRIAPRHIGTSAELLPEALREQVRQTFGVDVHDTYGATELAPIATQCRHGHLHLLEDRAIVEIVDDCGHAVPMGEAGAQLLLTVFGRRTQPLIRYALGDRVRELPGPCPCGSALRRLAVVEGRSQESLLLPSAGQGSVTVHPRALHAELLSVPCSGWQVRQTQGPAGPQLQVLLTGEPAADVGDALQHAITRLLQRSGAGPVPVAVHWVEALPRGASGKAPLIVRETA